VHKKGIKIVKVVEMTGLSYPAVRAVIDLFDADGWYAIRPACRGRSKGDGAGAACNASASAPSSPLDHIER
jgi:hypothetical protein